MAGTLLDDEVERLLAEAEERLGARNAPSKAVINVSQENAVVASAAGMDLIQSSSGKSEVPSIRKDVAVRTPQLNVKRGKGVQDDAGADWFNMPKTKLTPEFKKDLQLLKMREVLDTKQHWRKDTRKDFIPKFSHVGTLIDGPLDAAHSSRLTKKQRKRTIVEEVLDSASSNAKFKTRYNEVQTRKMSGRKGYYKKLVAQRKRRP